jgi:uncharacterized protein YheU (UPF0270 family)
MTEIDNLVSRDEILNGQQTDEAHILYHILHELVQIKQQMHLLK